MDYKGHAIERQGDRFVVQPYGHDFASVGEAQAWIDGHVDRESKKSARPGSVLDIVKGTAGHRVDFEASLAKAGQPKPPSGYSPVPGGMHGGFRKKIGAKWRYWYPSTEAAEEAGRHHRAEAKKNARDPRSPYYSAESSKPWAIEMDRQRRDHAEHADGAADFLSRERDKAYRKQSKKVDAEREVKRVAAVEAARSEGAPVAEGKHRIATRDGYTDVTTVARHGLYAVHGEATRDSLNPRKNSKYSFTVTHVPTGHAVGFAPTKAEAVGFARHFHETAGDAGKDAGLAERPSEADTRRIGNAYQTWGTSEYHPKNRTRKSEEITYRIGSVNYVQAPTYAAPEGGDVARPGMLHTHRAQPPVIDDGRDPIIPELARLNGQLVDPRHGILAMVRRNGG